MVEKYDKKLDCDGCNNLAFYVHENVENYFPPRLTQLLNAKTRRTATSLSCPHCSKPLELMDVELEKIDSPKYCRAR